jgi:deoxyribodipyrimidine photo-lyase
VAFHAFKDHVIFEGDEIKTGAGTPFKVFTPYKRVWSEALAPNMVAPHSPVLSKLMRQSECARVSCAWELHNIGFEKNALWLQTGERAAQARLRAFGAKIANYNERRNFPALSDGTSGLSVHLRFGTLSIREAVRFALKHKSTGASTWLSELVWRDFYQMILDQFPYVVEGAFKREYDRLRWPGSSAHFEAWVKGRTGFPIIDAAMRHFAATGWMHNRLRMVVASFLTKDLLVHWKEGEAYFARYLLDFDLAANNGGWQWAASTGCDAQPYFRIFNPVSQSEKFDPDGAFIRANVPELNGFSKKRIHWPHEAPASEQNIAHCQLGKDYPHPIVEHHRQRLKCLQMFKAARKP